MLLDQPLTGPLIQTTIIACISTLQFGYHLAELNAPEAIISCQSNVPGPSGNYSNTFFGRNDVPQCIHMGANGIGAMVSMYSLGGLLSSLLAGSLSNKYGRKTVSVVNCINFMLGPLIMTFSRTLTAMCVGRFISGLAAGASLVIVPVYVNEISPHCQRGLLGAMVQLSVNSGMLLAQVLGLVLSNSEQWRYILFAGFVLGLLNMILLLTNVESPKWLTKQSRFDEAKITLEYLRQETNVLHEIEHWGKAEADETTYLLESTTPGYRRNSINPSTVSPLDFLLSKRFRQSAIVVIGVMSAQQLTGMNSVTFYGVSVLSKIVPNYAVLLNCFITFVGLVTNAIVSPFVDRLGRKPFLLLSLAIMGSSACFMTFGILNNYQIMCAVSMLTFVSAFSIGLGPIPSLLIPEVTRHTAVSSAQSVGMVANWLSTISIGFLFPIVNSSIGGYVYLIFAAIAAFYFVFIAKFVPETKGKLTYEEVWNLSVMDM